MIFSLLFLQMFCIISPAAASEIHDSIIIAIQSVKTFQIRPFEPVENDMLSVYNKVYEEICSDVTLLSKYHWTKIYAKLKIDKIV